MKKMIYCFLLFYFMTTSFYSNVLKLTVAGQEDGSHKYYFELLNKSLKAIGYRLDLNIRHNIPQKRAVNMLEKDQISLHWLVQNKERDKQFIPVEIGLTQGLIGHRVLFIPEGAQSQYNNVKNLADFRKINKIGGFGKNWYDVKVWKANQLKYYEKDGQWRVLYEMVAKGNRGVDYFSRGINEIVLEAPQNPDLAVEKNLILIYDRDFRFYLSKSAAKHKAILEKALANAQKKGIINQLVRKYWKDVFNKYNFDQRIKIKLITP